MIKRTTLSALLVLSGIASTASAQVWSESFDAQSNEGAWEIWWNNYNVIETQGGNPGSYLHFDNLTGSANCQFVEIFPTVWPASFSGDWQTAGVQGLGFDMDVRSGPPNTSFGAITVRVGFDNGTPGNWRDETQAAGTHGKRKIIGSAHDVLDFDAGRGFELKGRNKRTLIYRRYLTADPVVGQLDLEHLAPALELVRCIRRPSPPWHREDRGRREFAVLDWNSRGLGVRSLRACGSHRPSLLLRGAHAHRRQCSKLLLDPG